MKDSVLLLSCFLLGILFSYNNWLPTFLLATDFSTYALYALMLLVGLGTGMDETARRSVLTVRLKVVMVPLSVVVGTLLGVAVISLLVSTIDMRNALAVGAGFGYYSLSSIFISELSGETMGVIALISNILREVLTLVAAPFLVRYFGRLAAISSGGATSMDSSLPAIVKSTGKDYVVIAIFNGIVLSVLVPFLVSFILKF